MQRILVSEYLPEPQLEFLRGRYDVTYDPDLYADRPALLHHAADADAIVIRNRTRIDAGLLAGAPRLKAVGRLGVGLDNIDLEACSAAGTGVFPAVGGNTVSVAEYVIGAMLVLLRGVYTMTGNVAAGEWPRRPIAFGNEANGKTLGLLGYGAIAQQVAVRARAFGMNVIACDPYLPADDPAWDTAKPSDLAAVLAHADVVSVHTPLTDETRHLIDEAALAEMKRTSILINTSRGGVVDEEAVVAALRATTIGAAALDVFSSEPLDRQRAARFAGVDNLLLTPHVAGNTAESVDRVAWMTVEAVHAALTG